VQSAGQDPLVRWEIGLCWSEYRAGGWSPTQRTAGAGNVQVPVGQTYEKADYDPDPGRYHAFLHDAGTELIVGLAGPVPLASGHELDHHRLARFVLDSCHAGVQGFADYSGSEWMTVPNSFDIMATRFVHSPTNNIFMPDKLYLEFNRRILKNIQSPTVLVRSPDLLNTTKLYPFFFSDTRGVYFAHPVPAGTAAYENPDPWSAVDPLNYLDGYDV
jgi:hypothetical protein